MTDKLKIEKILSFTCDCGYEFKNYKNDIGKFKLSEYGDGWRSIFVICPTCSKRYSVDRLIIYIRKQKIKRITEKWQIIKI